MGNLHILHSNYSFCSGDKIIIYSVKIIIDFLPNEKLQPDLITAAPSFASRISYCTTPLTPPDFHLLGQSSCLGKGRNTKGSVQILAGAARETSKW